MKYLVKNAYVDAVQWAGDMDAVTAAVGRGFATYGPEGQPGSLRIPGYHGDIECKLGDWIIRGITGVFFAMGPEQFVADYAEQGPVPRPFTATHFTDSQNNPAGGTTFGVGFAIGWQNGPLNRGVYRLEPNGAFVETIIKAAADRLEFYQASKFKSDYNAEALGHLYAALDALNRRTADRERRRVEGTHEL